MRWIENPKVFRFLMNFWPPLRGAGIKIDHISEDFRKIIISLQLKWYNQNYVGTHFGGSLFAMTDPFFMLMLIRNLGKNYRVLDHSASIHYVQPGRGIVKAIFIIREEQITEIKDLTATGEKYFAEFKIDVVDSNDNIVAQVDKTIYIRKRVLLPSRNSPINSKDGN